MSPRATTPELGHKICFADCSHAVEEILAIDIIDIPMGRGFVDLAVELYWVRRRVCLGGCRSKWKLPSASRTLEDALSHHDKQEKLNANQGSQVTGSAFITGLLTRNDIAISVGGKGAWRDNEFVRPAVDIAFGPTKASARHEIRIGRYID